MRGPAACPGIVRGDGGKRKADGAVGGEFEGYKRPRGERPN